MLLETQLAEPSSLKGAERAKVVALTQKFADEEKRYNTEKKEIEADAKKLEGTRDHRRDRPDLHAALPAPPLTGLGLNASALSQPPRAHDQGSPTRADSWVSG